MSKSVRDKAVIKSSSRVIVRVGEGRVKLIFLKPLKEEMTRGC